MSARGSEGSGAASGSLALFCLLLALAVAAFALTRAARSEDDFVNTVALTPEVSLASAREEPARIELTLARADDDVSVEIVDGRGGSGGAMVAELVEGADLDAGPHSFEWDGRNEAGESVAPGPYAIRVSLGEADRTIQPPGRIEVVP